MSGTTWVSIAGVGVTVVASGVAVWFAVSAHRSARRALRAHGLGPSYGLTPRDIGARRAH